MKLIKPYEHLSEHSVSLLEDRALCLSGSACESREACVDNNFEALEVGDSLSVPVGKTGEGLLVDLLDLLEVGGNVALSGALAGEDELP